MGGFVAVAGLPEPMWADRVDIYCELHMWNHNDVHFAIFSIINVFDTSTTKDSKVEYNHESN